MQCEECREALSARLDGEDEGWPSVDVDRHIASCAACGAFAASAGLLHRAVRVQPADAVPDLLTAILARVPVRAATRAPRAREWPRYVLLTVALTQLVLALPALILGNDPGASVHIARELGAWDVALAVGLLVAAWQPKRAAGLLPFVAALTGAMVLTAALDMLAGRAGPGEAQHVTDVVGLVALWFLAQPAGPVRFSFRADAGVA